MKHLLWLPAVLVIFAAACSGPAPTIQARAGGASSAAECSSVDTSTLDFEHQDILRYECLAR